MEPTAAEGLTELGGDSLQVLTAADLPALLNLRSAMPRGMFELPGTAVEIDAFIRGLAGRPWSLPMICRHDGDPVGLCLMSVAQLRNLNAYVVAVFTEPAVASGLLALYIRHAFWSFPLHRLYVHLPISEGFAPYSDLFSRVGFKTEGVLAGHIPTQSGRGDVLALGLLRDDFEAWCAANQPELSLV
jgi:RimJ/RimL family protein N-acetyltransferase